MKTKAIFTQLFLILLLTGGTQVYAQGRNFQQGEHPGRYQNIPDLTDEQKDQIDEIRQNHYNTTKELRAELEILRAEKQKLMIADNPDEKAINAKIDEMGTIHTRMQKAGTARHLAIRNLLTAEQKMYFDTHCNNRHHRGMKANMHMKPNRNFPGGGQGQGMGLRDGSCRE